MEIKNDLENEIYPVLPPTVRETIDKFSSNCSFSIQEIRLRQGRPLMLVADHLDYMFDAGNWTTAPHSPYIVTKKEMVKTFQLISQGSVYALEEELKNGYLTLPGGHRVGFVGEAVLHGGRVRTLKNISGFNIRIAREIPGVADEVIPYIITQDEDIYSTLIISPPKAGKTTLLRDMIRQLSTGIEPFKGWKIGVVDERSEIACSFDGQPQKDVGIRTDVLDGCPKAQGMIMLLRSMSPDVIATDEIGRSEDIVAIEEAINAGVSIITTAHGKDLDSIKMRPTMSRFIEYKFFKRYIILGFSRGVGTIEEIIDAENNSTILQRSMNKRGHPKCALN